MASNKLPEQLDLLFTQAEDMADGLHANEMTVGIKQNTEAALRAALTAAQAAESLFQTKRRDKVAATTAQTVVDSNGKAFIATAKNVLEHYLGKKWSPAWAAAGFVNTSTATPATLAERQTCLGALQTYFTANPAHQNNPLQVTAAKAARDAAVLALHVRMSGLIAELGQLIKKDDPNWYAFGLSRPADAETPGIPDGLVLTAGPVGTVLVDWADARRAERYRVWKQVTGVDADFVP